VLTELEEERPQARTEHRLRVLAVLQQLLTAFADTLETLLVADTADFFCKFLPTLRGPRCRRGPAHSFVIYCKVYVDGSVCTVQGSCQAAAALAPWLLGSCIATIAACTHSYASSPRKTNDMSSSCLQSRTTCLLS